MADSTQGNFTIHYAGNLKKHHFLCCVWCFLFVFFFTVGVMYHYEKDAAFKNFTVSISFYYIIFIVLPYTLCLNLEGDLYLCHRNLFRKTFNVVELCTG